MLRYIFVIQDFSEREGCKSDLWQIESWSVLSNFSRNGRFWLGNEKGNAKIWNAKTCAPSWIMMSFIGSFQKCIIQGYQLILWNWQLLSWSNIYIVVCITICDYFRIILKKIWTLKVWSYCLDRPQNLYCLLWKCV